MGDVEKLVKLGLIGLGIYAFLKALEEGGKNTQTNRCPNCNYLVLPGQIRCLQCGQLLNWEGLNK